MFFCRHVLSKFKVGPKIAVFAPSPWGCLGSSDQIFQIAFISEYVSKFGFEIRLVTSEIRRRIKKEIKREKTTAVNYKPYGIWLITSLFAFFCGQGSSTQSGDD